MNNKNLFLAVSLISFSTLNHADPQVCNQLLQTGYSNIYKQTSVHDQAMAYARDYCSYDYDSALKDQKQRICNAGKQMSGFNFGLDIPVEEIPIGFDAGVSNDSEYNSCIESSNTEISNAQSQLCYNSSGQKKDFKFNNIDSSTISNDALQAWQSCMQLQANYVDIKMTPTTNQLSVSISMVYRGTGNPPNVTGLDIGNVGDATCKVTLPATKGTYKTIPMTDATSFKLASQYRNISCKRLPSNTDINGVVSYLPVRFTVKTDSGDFITDMPAVGQAPLASINDTVNAAVNPIQTSLNQTIANNQTAIAQVKTDYQNAISQALASPTNSINSIVGSVNSLQSQVDVLKNGLVWAVNIAASEGGISTCQGWQHDCLAAAHRYCQGKGYKGGFPQEWVGGRMDILCVK